MDLNGYDNFHSESQSLLFKARLNNNFQGKLNEMGAYYDK